MYTHIPGIDACGCSGRVTQFTSPPDLVYWHTSIANIKGICPLLRKYILVRSCQMYSISSSSVSSTFKLQQIPPCIWRITRCSYFERERDLFFFFHSTELPPMLSRYDSLYESRNNILLESYQRYPRFSTFGIYLASGSN